MAKHLCKYKAKKPEISNSQAKKGFIVKTCPRFNPFLQQLLMNASVKQ
jgi:hypothetical protein